MLDRLSVSGVTCAILSGVLGVIAIVPGVGQQKSAAPKDPQGFYKTEVRPLLQKHCISCHGGEKPAGGLDLTRREGLLKGGPSGAAISLTDPSASLLVKAINYDAIQMPPSGKIPQAAIVTLTTWVKMGAPYAPAVKAEEPKPFKPPQVSAETKKFWSFQPIHRPLAPAVKDRVWLKSPIDAFILHKLEANRLKPNAPASRTALLRRAYYDLIGLPPSPEDVRAFVADTSANAYERVVDRLLASPQYGEKWGRHWLDLVHYAETNSYERDGIKPNAWRYRDYVIGAFNQDKPYDQFVREQLAGDELPNRTPEKLIATGYYRLGIWDDEPSDHDQALYDDMDDLVRTTSETFLGLTVGCARCHDHKIDPIPQKDYYSFVSFFAGVNRYGPQAQRSIAPEEVQRVQKLATAAHEAKLKTNRNAIDAIEKRLAADFTPVEKEEFRTEASRTPTIKKRVGKLITAEEFDQYLELRREERRLKSVQPAAMDMALCVSEDAQPRGSHILLRGNPHVEGEEVKPAFLQVLNPPIAEVAPTPYGDSCGRRLALANWIVSPQNPLAARVMANRLWQYHFGRGIVRTSSNFGFQGSAPTHPELLDWLATDLVASGWKLKPLHRKIMLSATYQMSAVNNTVASAKDPENDLMWRFDMRRLEAEEVRDSILAVNGSLNAQAGGLGVFTEIPALVLAGQSRPGDGWGKSPEDQQNRRSIYIHVKRSLIDPIIAGFDGPETDFTCPVRFATTQPTQALSLLNSDFINKEARKFAVYLKSHSSGVPAAQVKLALQRVLQREPTPRETARGIAFIQDCLQKDRLKPDDALAAFCVVALNLNEFMYLE